MSTQLDLDVEVIDNDSIPATEAPRVVDLLQTNEPEVMTEVRTYFSMLQISYQARAKAIEEFLGFVESAEALSARLQRIEKFLGLWS
jgi:hypothetical protein